MVDGLYHRAVATKDERRAQLTAVYREARGCTRCPELASTRRQVVFGAGNADADLMFVGEAPGAKEDEQGIPFVGAAGKLLSQLLEEVGLARSDVFIANVLRCRPPANRTPRRSEVQRCRPWLSRQLDLVDPVVVVALGGTAAQWFFGTGARIAALRGQPRAYDGRQVLVTYHPSAAIRFGPRGAPLAALREDLALAAGLVAAARR